MIHQTWGQSLLIKFAEGEREREGETRAPQGRGIRQTDLREGEGLPSPQFSGPFIVGAVLSSIEQPHAGTLSQAGPHDNNKDQFESGSKMQKLVLSMP